MGVVPRAGPETMSTDRARSLRKQMPPAEARLWNALRQLKPLGHHFRRQVPLGGYYADFASHAARLVIEVDGDTHGTDAARRYDAARTTFLRAEGYTVLRVTNDDVLHNIDGVIATVLRQLAEPAPPATPTLDPSPQGGGRRRSRAIVELGQIGLADLPPPVGRPLQPDLDP